MPIQVVTGPPFSGKTQKVNAVRLPSDIVLDTTPLWRTMFNPPAGAVREVEHAAVVNAMKREGVRRAVQQELDGYVIVAARQPERLKRWLDVAKQGRASLITEPFAVLTQRAQRAGPECEKLLDDWDNFQEDEEFMSLVEAWDGDRSMTEFERLYRAACDAEARDDGCGQRLQMRCLTVDCELRAGEGDESRVVSGVAVRYGDKATIWGYKESIRAGALKMPKGKSNLTVQHDRAQPLAVIEYTDGPDALRIRSELPEGMRQDQALADIRSGLYRGLSIEFMPTEDVVNDKAKTVEILKGNLYRVSVVDDPAYPKSKMTKRDACGCGAPRADVEVTEAVIADLPRVADLYGIDRHFLI